MLAMLRPLLFAVAALVLLSGCAAISALSGGPSQDTYQVSATPDLPTSSGRPQQVDIVIEEPTSSAALDTESILIRPMPNQVQYLPDARWIEPVPLMLQSALIDGLERTGAFRYVGRRPLGPSGDYALVMNLLEFNAELLPNGDGAEINIRVIGRLVREDDAAIVATRSFVTVLGIPDTDTRTIVDGFDRASTQVLDDMIGWLLSTRGVRVAG